MRRHTIVRVLGLAAWVCGALVIGSPAAHEQLGKVHFPVSCSPAAQAQFDRAIAMLHSFFYPETVKAFTAVTQSEPSCAMAYSGAARAAELAGDREKAKVYYAKLVTMADKADTDRPELAYARAFLAK